MKLVQIIVVKHAIVDSLSAGTILVNFLPLIGTIRNRTKEFVIGFVVVLNNMAICRRGALIHKWAAINLAHLHLASELCCHFGTVVTITGHAMTGGTNGSTVVRITVFKLCIWLL